MTFEEVRQKHQQFIYEGSEILSEGQDLKITFNFLITPDIRFKPEIILPTADRKQDLDNLVFNLGMIELISYWKAACPAEIVIRAGFLDEQQIKFWKKLLVNGLGEFFYTNKIDFTKDDLVEFKIENKKKFPLFDGKLNDRNLILIGGGKDSAVTLDNLGKTGKEFGCLLLNPTEAALKISKAGKCPNPIIIRRTIDPKLLNLNKQGYLNGHTPFSAYLAFLSALAGVTYDFKNIIVSNEASADEANVQWKGMLINHQYSKTSQFEKDFRSYCQKYLSSDINYFSFLRNLGELQISKLFSRMEKYHKIFRSCNKGSKTSSWCGKCAKCVSTYLTLYPFLGNKTKEIFRRDLLNSKGLIPIVNELLRKNTAAKPFECVATVTEIKAAIILGRERAKKDGQKIPTLLQIKI